MLKLKVDKMLRKTLVSGLETGMTIAVLEPGTDYMVIFDDILTQEKAQEIKKEFGELTPTKTTKLLVLPDGVDIQELGRG